MESCLKKEQRALSLPKQRKSNMKKLRLSYSLLNEWERACMSGDFDKVINTYLHLSTTPTPAMKRGIEFDDDVRLAVETSQVLPSEIGSIKLTSPKAQARFEVSYNDMFDLVSVLDVWDSGTIYETKCSSVHDAGDYASDFQIPFYFLTLTRASKPVDKAWILAYNWSNKTYTSALIWYNTRMVTEAQNLVEKYGPEIYKFLEEREVL